jgi:nitroreductase
MVQSVINQQKGSIKMEFFEVVERRASYRGAFAEQSVPEADIRKILSAGISAPSGYNFQTTSFVVVRDPAVREAIAALLPTPATRTAPVMLVAISEQKVNEAKGAAHFHFDTEDYAAAVENVMLAITALGYAGVWMDGMSRMDDKDAAIAKLLQVPAGKTVRTVIPFGVPTGPVRQKEKKPFEERVFWEHF